MAVIAQVIITVQGRVQGVGYRAACVQRARLLGLRGWVRNRRDGAVEAFLAGRIRFDQIHALNLATLEAVVPARPASLADLLALDAQARADATQAISRLT